MIDTLCECCGDYPGWLLPDGTLDSSTCHCSSVLCTNPVDGEYHCIACCKCPDDEIFEPEDDTLGEIEILEERIV